MGKKELRCVLKEVMVQNQTQSQSVNEINTTEKIQKHNVSNTPTPE